MKSQKFFSLISGRLHVDVESVVLSLCRRWSREEALLYMAQNSLLSENSRRSELRRYATWPGQVRSLGGPGGAFLHFQDTKVLVHSEDEQKGKFVASPHMRRPEPLASKVLRELVQDGAKRVPSSASSKCRSDFPRKDLCEGSICICAWTPPSF